MRPLLPVLLSLSAVAPAATVAPFEGDPVAGGALRFSRDAVTVGQTTVKLADCDWIVAGEAHATVAKSRLGVWLVDGSWLPVDRIGPAEGRDDAILAAGPLGELVLPLGAVLGWGADLIALGEGGTDRAVVASGPMSGRALGIAEGKLKWESPLSPQPLQLALGEVPSLRLAQPVRPPKGVVLAATTDPQRPPLLLLPSEGLPLAAAPTVATGDALAGAHLRVEGGRRVYLGALKPSKVDEVGAFDVVWHWKVDADLEGGPLLLGGTRYAHGISVHSKATLAWDLGGAYAHLRAVAGIADLVAPEGDCAVDVVGDGKSLWSRPSVRGGEKPIALDVELKGVKTLELHVDYGAKYDIGDHFTLADAWLLKAR
jgi:hypothetical protein